MQIIDDVYTGDHLTSRQVRFGWTFIFAGLAYALATAYEFHRCSLIADANEKDTYIQSLCVSWFVGMVICWMLFWILNFQILIRNMFGTEATKTGIVEFGKVLTLIGCYFMFVPIPISAIVFLMAPSDWFAFVFKFLLALIGCGYMFMVSGHGLWTDFDSIKSTYERRKSLVFFRFKK